MSDIVTEFTEVDPAEFHLVGKGAAGFPILLAKAAVDEVDAVLAGADELTKASWQGFCGWDACKLCKEKFGESFAGLIEKSKLKAKDRKKLPKSAFALPEQRAYPIHDENHAHAALSELHNATPEEQARIKAAVHSRYPDIKIGDDVKDKAKKEGTSQEAEEAKPIPPESAAQVQSNEVDGEQGAIHVDVLPDGTHIRVPSFTGHPAPTQSAEGHGSTAPEKGLPVKEAQTQSAGLARKAGEGDGRGDPAPDGEKDDAAAEAEARRQTEEVSRKGAPGSPEWEDKDAALAAEASQLVERANGLIEEFESREKTEGAAEGDASAKATAIREAAKSLSEALVGTPSSAAKEIEMTADELANFLDARDALKASELKKAEKMKKKKDKKKDDMKGMSDEEMAEKAASDPAFKARLEKRNAKAARKAAKAAPQFELVTKALADVTTVVGELQKQVDVIGAQPVPTKLLNAGGIEAAGGVAALRAAAPHGAFEVLEKAVHDAETSGTAEDLSKATKELTTARMVAFERLRASGMSNDAALAAVR